MVLEVVLVVVTKLEEGVKGKKNVNREAKGELDKAREALENAKRDLEGAKVNLGNDNGKELETAKVKLEALSNNGSGLLKQMWDNLRNDQKSLLHFIDVSGGKLQVDPGKNTINNGNIAIVETYCWYYTSSTIIGKKFIKTLIDQLALGLQKWVGWQNQGDECCLKGDGGVSNGIGKKCERNGTNCCGDKSNHDCETCGTKTRGGSSTYVASGDNKCYLSAYCKKNGAARSPPSDYLWTSISSDSTNVHLLARIFLGSVCLIWSGLSQLGFLTGGSGGGDYMYIGREIVHSRCRTR